MDPQPNKHPIPDSTLLFTTLICLFGAVSSYGLNTWQQISTQTLIRSMIFTANGDLYVAADTFQVYRSRNKGQTWENLHAGLPAVSGAAVLGGTLGLYAAGEVLYAAGSTPSHLFRLVNNGTTWRDATHDQPWNHGDAIGSITSKPAGDVFLCLANGLVFHHSGALGGVAFAFDPVDRSAERCCGRAPSRGRAFGLERGSGGGRLGGLKPKGPCVG